MQRLMAARNFNRGFADGGIRRLGAGRSRLPSRRRSREGFDVNAFETRGARPHRHAGGDRRCGTGRPHFAHVFSGGGYASAYYSYMWSEVLDADAFAAFEETGDIFDPATAKSLHDHVYSAGGRATRPSSTRRSAAGCRRLRRCYGGADL